MNQTINRWTRTGTATAGARLLLSLTLMLLAAAPIWAQPGFVITLPTAGSSQPAGQPIAITWSGGDPSWNVAVYLIDQAAGTVVGGTGVIPNNGVTFWTIPTSLPFGGPCGRTYRFYVENSPVTQWIYGPLFTANCPGSPVTYNIASGDAAGLIAAINAANATPQPDIINLAPFGSYELTSGYSNPDDWFHGPTGLPWITRPLTINGFGAQIYRSNAAGTPDFRIAYAFLSDLTLNEVQINNGRGGGSQRGGAGLAAIGATLIVRNSTVAGNTAPGGSAGGGGIHGICSLVIVENSTISLNTTSSGYGGGGILNWSGGPGCFGRVLISNSTIFGNREIAAGRGDAIADSFSPPGHVVVKNSILASPAQTTTDDCYAPAGVISSLGHNIASDSSCAFSSPGDLNSTDPKLLAHLNYWGGPTGVHLPLDGSPAIDAVPVADCTNVFGVVLTRDQRGSVRPGGVACDIGSVDVAGDTTPPVITPNVSGSLGTGGWYRSTVTVSWTVTDAETGIASSSGCGTSVLTADTAGVTLTCSATNNIGLTASQSVTVRIDQTPPVISGSRSPAPNATGWNNTDVNVGFTCSDALSGVGYLSPLSTTLTTEGINLSVGGTCTDNAGNTAVAAVGGIHIDKTKPVVSGLTANPNPAPINTAIALLAALSDSGGSNLSAAQFSINGSLPAFLGAASGPTSSLNGVLPAFADTGVYNICVRAVDQAGNVGLDECLFLPVYDPAAGFVTGGGWINSPPGAYIANPALTGKANFGFESRYKPGAQVPSGDTQFQFKAGDLNFKSKTYQWLVVGGAKAQYKGTGTINGSGDYTFMLTAIDGGLPGGGNEDRFRIKITGPGGVVYDNQLGGGDNDDPTTVLGGGSIVIHKK